MFGTSQEMLDAARSGELKQELAKRQPPPPRAHNLERGIDPVDLYIDVLFGVRDGRVD